MPTDNIHSKEYWNRRVRENMGNLNAMIFRDPRFYEYEKRTQDFLETFYGEDDVLDIACGYGRFAPVFSINRYLGVDFSEEMIKLAKERNPHYDFVLADSSEYKPEKVVDVVFEVNSLHSLGQTPEQFYEQWKGCAKKAVACLECDRFTIFQVYETSNNRTR